METLVPVACPVNDEVLFRHDIEDLPVLSPPPERRTWDTHRYRVV